MINPLLKAFATQKRWVNFRFQELKGKTTKVPYDIRGKLASSVDEKSWATYKEAKAVSDQVGIVFTPAQDLLGIDIDHCINPDTLAIEHAAKNAIALLILEADTYTELSPSGTGIHLFLKLTAPLKLAANKHAPFEMYTSGRYFTVTGKPYGETRDVRTVSPETALQLLEIAGYPWGKTDDAVEQKPVPHPQTAVNDDAVIIEKMFGAKNGIGTKALYDGDTSAYKGDGSSADMALLSHLAFWTRKDAAQMERIWLTSPLGSRKKTQERGDYRKRTIATAIKGCKEVYETAAMKLESEFPDLDLLYTLNSKKDKVFTQNTENICRILRKYPIFDGRFRYDTFKNALEMKPGEARAWRDLEDNDAVDIQTQIQIHFPFFGKVGKDMVYDAIVKVSKERTIDSAADFITGLKWDGTARLDTWLSKVYGVEENEYHRAAGANWLKGLVRRIVEPGCKFDYVLVLEGEQGIKKSTSLNVLGNGWHVETTMSTESKDFFMQFQGKAIIEFSEGETLSRTEVKRMKAIITMQSDKYRPAYGRLSIDFPRRCVFAMTTNQTEYLKDETGNRRWLPVACTGVADIAWLTGNRDQLFAEAYHRVVTLKESTWEFPEEETLAMQQARRIHDPNEDLIVNWYVNVASPQSREEGVTVYQAYRDGMCGGMVTKQLDRMTEMSISQTFRIVLGLVNRRKMLSGMQQMRWFNDKQLELPGIEIPKSEVQKVWDKF